MVDKEWMEGYDPVAAGEQAEDGTDLVGIRYNLSLSLSQRIEQHRRAAASMQWLMKLRHDAESSLLARHLEAEGLRYVLVGGMAAQSTAGPA